MSTGLILAIVVVALLVLAAIVFLGKKGRERRLEGKREDAREIRHEAQVSGARGERQHAEAQERAARARKEQAAADEQAAEADKHRRFAAEKQEEAQSLDPDAGDEDQAREEHAERERR